MNGWVYVVCGRNVALGVYVHQCDAISSVTLTCDDATIIVGSPGKPYIEMMGGNGEHLFTITKVRTGGISRLF